MKLHSVVLQPESTTDGQDENGGRIRDRMRRFWLRPENAVLYPVGHLLAKRAVDGRKLAAIVASGEAVELESILIDGNELPLAANTVISLSTVGTWGCPACRSAHGSGVGRSTVVSADSLVNNRFYYRPADQRLFVISDSCFGKYVKEPGMDTSTRFVALTPKTVVTPRGIAAPSPCDEKSLAGQSDAENFVENEESLAEQTEGLDSLNRRMGELNDSDLWNTLSYFYPMFHNLVSTASKELGMSIGHVQRVLDGDRKSEKVQAAVVCEFRRRIQSYNGRRVRIASVPFQIRSAAQVESTKSV